MFDKRFSWVSITNLFFPVVPDVKNIAAQELGSRLIPQTLDIWDELTLEYPVFVSMIFPTQGGTIEPEINLVYFESTIICSTSA